MVSACHEALDDGIVGSQSKETAKLPPESDSAEQSAYDALAFQFIATPKRLAGPMRWRSHANHQDYDICQCRLSHDMSKRIKGRIILLSHRYFFPRKYSFSMIMDRQRVYSLDVGPRLAHKNLINKNSIKGTHWSIHPCTEVEQDDRQMFHQLWLDNFLKRCNIVQGQRYYGPVHEWEQPRLPFL